MKRLWPMLFVAISLYCGVWILTASSTFWFADVLTSLFLHNSDRLEGAPFNEIFNVMALLFYGPMLPFIFCFGYLHLYWLNSNQFQNRDKRQWIRRSLKIGIEIGILELLTSIFIGGSLRSTWWSNIIMFGLPAMLASIACGIVVGYFWAQQAHAITEE